MIVATASRLAFQALPLMLISLPTTVATGAKIAAKSVFMGLIYNIAPKILNKMMPQPKNKTVKTVSDNIMQSSIAAIGSGMLTTALGGPQYTISSILKETLQERRQLKLHTLTSRRLHHAANYAIQ